MRGKCLWECSTIDRLHCQSPKEVWLCTHVRTWWLCMECLCVKVSTGTSFTSPFGAFCSCPLGLLGSLWRTTSRELVRMYVCHCSYCIHVCIGGSVCSNGDSSNWMDHLTHSPFTGRAGVVRHSVLCNGLRHMCTRWQCAWRGQCTHLSWCSVFMSTVECVRAGTAFWHSKLRWKSFKSFETLFVVILHRWHHFHMTGIKELTAEEL